MRIRRNPKVHVREFPNRTKGEEAVAKLKKTGKYRMISLTREIRYVLRYHK